MLFSILTIRDIVAYKAVTDNGEILYLSIAECLQIVVGGLWSSLIGRRWLKTCFVDLLSHIHEAVPA